jgi:hypothetical protein
MVALPGVNRALAATLPATPAAPAVTSGSGGGVHPDTGAGTNGQTTLWVYGSGLTVDYSQVTQQAPCGPYEWSYEFASLGPNGGDFSEYSPLGGAVPYGYTCQPSTTFTFPGFQSDINTTLYGYFYNGDYWTNPATVSIYD